MSKESDQIKAAAEAFTKGLTVDEITELFLRVDNIEKDIDFLRTQYDETIAGMSVEIHALRNTVNMMKRNQRILG